MSSTNSFLKNGACLVCHNQHYSVHRAGDHAVARRCQACMAFCPECEGTGYVFVTRKKGYQGVKPCERCANLDRRIRLFNEAQLPARYHDRVLPDFVAYHKNDNNLPLGNLPDIKGKLYSYSTEFIPGNKGLILSGKVGTGKTHLLVTLLRYFTLEKGIPCRFIEFTHLLTDLRAAYETHSNATEILNRLSDIDVLAIDELGKGRKNDWQLGVIDELISKRYNRCLSTFFTTNYSLQDRPQLKPKGSGVNVEDPDFRHSLEMETLVDRVGRRIVSRLFEMADPVEFTNVPDYRQGSAPGGT